MLERERERETVEGEGIVVYEKVRVGEALWLPSVTVDNRISTLYEDQINMGVAEKLLYGRSDQSRTTNPDEVSCDKRREDRHVDTTVGSIVRET
jgi:hypothetical protein